MWMEGGGLEEGNTSGVRGPLAGLPFPHSEAHSTGDGVVVGNKVHRSE